MDNPLEGLTTRTIPAKYSFLQNLQIGLDVIVIVSWVVAALVYAFTLGRKHMPILLLSTYAGLAVSVVIQKLNVVDGVKEFQNSEFFPLFIFLFTAVLAFVSLIRVIRSRSRGAFGRNGALLLSGLEMGAFLSTAASFLPSDFKGQIVGFASVLFVNSWTQALWLIIPLIIFLIGEHRRKSSFSADE